MAQLLQFPVLFSKSLRLTSIRVQRRQFSCISPLCAAPPKEQMPRVRPQPKLTAYNKENEFQMVKMRDDFGLLEGTFIMPTGTNRPPITSKDLYKLLWLRFYRHIRDWMGLMLYKWNHLKPRPAIRFRATKAAAIGLHRQMYEAFATGDEATIKAICAEGLSDKMINRISHRKPGETFKWEIVKEGWSKVVSHRAAPLPIENCGIRQAVVRIKSTQKLTRYDAQGNEVAGTRRPKPLVEYIVIQKKTIRGNDARWKIWGTTNETTLAMIERQEAEDMERYG